MIYFVQDTATGNIKIGRSVDPRARIKTLQTGTAATLKLLALENGSRELEISLHRKFADERLSGEWFRASPDLLDYIDQLPLIQGNGLPAQSEKVSDEFTARAVKWVQYLCKREANKQQKHPRFCCEDVAAKIGVTPSYIAYCRRGTSGQVTAHIYERIRCAAVAAYEQEIAECHDLLRHYKGEREIADRCSAHLAEAKALMTGASS